MTAIVGMALGQRPVPKAVKQESVAQPVHFLGSKNVSPYTCTYMYNIHLVLFISTYKYYVYTVLSYGSCTGLEKQRCGFESHLGQLTFSLKRRESEPSQVVLLCCLALYNYLIIHKSVNLALGLVTNSRQNHA